MFLLELSSRPMLVAYREHQNRIAVLDPEEVAKIPCYHRSAPLFYNHSELGAVKQIARDAGRPTPFYEELRELQEDNGERISWSTSRNSLHATVKSFPAH
jgi:hypothetical protein